MVSREILNRLQAARRPRERKTPAPISNRSDKMTAIIDQLKKLYPVFLRSHPACEIKSPVCTKKATVVHHSEGRGKNEVLDQRTWMASCTACNGWVEENDAEAREMGAKKSRHAKK